MFLLLFMEISNIIYPKVKKLKARLVRHLILLQTHKYSLLIMGLHIFEIKLC